MRPLPIPVEVLPIPRLIIWHGDPVTDEEQQQHALLVLDRAYRNMAQHLQLTGSQAAGDDWSGWHCPDRDVISGLCDVAESVMLRHWTVALELT